jgi:hypothetical protein
MCDHHRRVSALQLKNAEDTIRKKLRGMKYRLYMRVACNIPVYTKGNEVGLYHYRPKLERTGQLMSVFCWGADSYGYW